MTGINIGAMWRQTAIKMCFKMHAFISKGMGNEIYNAFIPLARNLEPKKRMCILVSCGFCNKPAQAWWLNRCLFSHSSGDQKFTGTTGPKPKCSQGWTPCGALRGESAPCLFQSHSCQHLLTQRTHASSLCPCLHTSPSFLCSWLLFSCLSLVRAIGFRSHTRPSSRVISHLKVFYSTLSTETLFLS